jgi:toxin YoeB
MELVWQTNAWEDYLYWQEQDKKMLRRINDLINDTLRSPFKGIGKPEPLKGDLSGYWSRRITDEHRLVYAVKEKRVHIIQCRFHYH